MPSRPEIIELTYSFAEDEKLCRKSWLHRFFTRDILFVVLFLFAITPLRFSFQQSLYQVCFIYTAYLFYVSRRSLHKSLLFVLFLWVVINSIAFLRFSGDLQSLPRGFIYQTLDIILPYMIVSLIGPSLYPTLEKWIFRLSLISIPLYWVQITFPSLMYRIAPIFRSVTGADQSASGGWYSGFFTFNSWGPTRNSGFMWEPGGFAFILIVALLVRFSMNRIKVDRHIVVYFICMITTFSTTGYIVGIIMTIIYFFRRANYIFPIFLLILLSIFTFRNIWGLDFMGPKIQQYIETKDVVGHTGGYNTRLKASRYGIMIQAIEESIANPIGYGVFPVKGYMEEYGEMLRGSNTYANVLNIWGWEGVLILIFAAYKLVKRLYPDQSQLVRALIFVCLLTMFFSNGFNRNALVIGMLYFPFIYPNNQVQQKLL